MRHNVHLYSFQMVDLEHYIAKDVGLSTGLSNATLGGKNINCACLKFGSSHLALKTS